MSLLFHLFCLPLFLSTTTFGWVVIENVRNKRTTVSTGMINQQQQSNVESNNDESSQFKVLGVCGGIGSGKSQACEILVSELGCIAHIDADKVAHVVYEKGSQSLKEIANEFGNNILQENGEINRQRLGGIVFSDPDAMSKLERIVWPHVKTEIQKRIGKLEIEYNKKHTNKNTNNNKDDNDDDNYNNNIDNTIVVVEAAMLLDAEWEDMLDGLWVITANEDVARNRLVTHRNLSIDDANERLKAQKKRRGIGNLLTEISNGIVTACIENNKSIVELKQGLSDALLDDKSWNYKRRNLIKE